MTNLVDGLTWNTGTTKLMACIGATKGVQNSNNEMIQNPYANKRRKAPSSSLTDASITNLNKSDSLALTEAVVGDIEINQNTIETTALSSEDDGIPNDKCDEGRKKSFSIGNKENEKSCMKSDVHYGQRLPSQRLTFGPAKILTVPEVYQQIHSTGRISSGESTDHPIAASIPSSIRVTGVVLHHHVHVIPDSFSEDIVVSIALGDPLRPAATPQHLKARRSLVSFALTPTELSPPPPPQRRKLDSTLRPTITKKNSTTVSVAKPDLQKTKKPVPILVYRKKTTPSSLLGSLSESRRLSFAAAVTEHSERKNGLPSSGLRRTKPPAMSSLDQLARRLDARTINHTPCVWIMVRLNTTTLLGSMEVNDLITVFGEIRRSSIAENESDGALDVIRTSAEQVASSSDLEYAFVQARIVRNANGTNMQLFTNALQARRRILES
jgi:hypothetical protein